MADVLPPRLHHRDDAPRIGTAEEVGVRGGPSFKIAEVDAAVAGCRHHEIISRLGLVSIAFIGLAACSPPPSTKDQYSGPWNEATGNVAVTLAHNQIRGCGEFYQKRNSHYQGEYAVACTRMPDGSDHAAWVGYLVWPAIDKVQGPDLIFVWNIGGPPRPDPR